MYQIEMTLLLCGVSFLGGLAVGLFIYIYNLERHVIWMQKLHEKIWSSSEGGDKDD
jgi:hypothetical protein